MLVLLACAPEPPPAAAPVEPAASPAAVAEPAVFALTGRATPKGLWVPDLPGGREKLDPACVPRDMACFVEHWSDGSRTVEVLRTGDRLAVDGRPARTRWLRLAAPLQVCLGDPFALPPAGDPGGQRALVGDRWRLTLTGRNACELGGVLFLDAFEDDADWSGLSVGGLPWDGGGRDALRPRAEALLEAAKAARPR